MTLQKKTLVILSFTLGVSILVLYFASRLIVLGSFSDQENADARQNMKRVQSALDDSAATLEGTTRDWGLWDDTYKYIKDKNETYYQSNLADNTPMLSNKLNVMILVDDAGNVVYARSLDYRTGTLATVPPGILRQIHRASPLVQHPTAASSIKGIISLTEGVMLIASEPIMHSSGTGDIAGTIIFGRYLDTDTIEHLAKTTLLSLTLEPLIGLNSSNLQQMAPTLTLEDPIQIESTSPTKLTGYYLIKDVFGSPALVIKAEMSRLVYERGVSTLGYYLFTIVCVGIVLGTVIWFMLRALVLSRLTRLKQEVGTIGLTSDTTARVNTRGNDELSGLAGSINDMLGALDRFRIERLESEERYRAVVEQSREAIFIVDAKTGRFIEANAAFQALLGYSADELAELHLADVVEVARETTSNQYRQTTGSLMLAVEKVYRRKDGTSVNLEVSDSRIIYGGRDVLCVVARDITDRKRAENALRELAKRDGLTGLYNHREMQRIMQEQIELHSGNGHPMSLILLDIDHFKTVNDTYGHLVGDAVLRWMALLIPQLVRPTDWVARYGGEEFAIILPDTSVEAAYERAERIRELIATHLFEYAPGVDFDSSVKNGPNSRRKHDELGVFIPITISLGVSGLSQGIDAKESLVADADKALYAAKHHGRNCTSTGNMSASKLRLITG